ncbi:MAG: NADH-quinone oxidoreductase subunit M [Chloroflexota bacterium]|nr:NADH-quinone oxidoreductase subunit M [Chloroflexota bacterium]
MQLFKEYALFLTILLPFAAAVALVFFPGTQKRAIRTFTASVAFLTMALSIYVMAVYDWGAGGFQMAKAFPWLADPFNISFAWGVDGISAPMVLLTGIVFFTGVIVSWNIEHRPKDFFVLYALMVSGVFGVFVSTDLFFLFFFYELAVIPMYLLIGVWGSTTDFKTFLRTKEYGAMKLTLYLVAGSVLVWVGIFALFTVGAGWADRTLSIPGLQALKDAGAFSHTFQLVIFPLFMLGFGVLAGLWPFHTWSPDGHVAAPTAVSMVHAGVLMKLGAYGIIRVGFTILPDGAQAWMPVLIGLGTVNVVYGAISAMGQRDLKYVVGYSSVSHMGIVLMGLATLNPIGLSGAVLQMFSHGVMTALFFTIVGAVYDRAHIRDMTVLNGLAKRMRVTTIFFVIVGLTSLGLPGLSGFVAELLVFIGVFRTYPVLAILAVIAAAITAVYILRMLAMAFFGPPDKDPRWEHLHDASGREVAAASILTLAIVFVGIYPAPLLRVINSGVTALLNGMKL